MQNMDELKWAEDTYGWQSSERNISKQKNSKSILNESDVKDKAIQTTASMQPHMIAIKKAKELTEKSAEMLRKNFEESRENDERDRMAGGRTSFPIYLLCGMLVPVFILSGPVLCVMLIACIYSSLPSVSGSTVVLQMEYDMQIVEAAQAELQLADENIGGQKYKDWYGINGNWCAMFVSFCANMCGYIEDGTMPRSCSVMEMSNWYKERGCWRNAGEYTPKTGDIIFFQNGMSHVGIVVSYDSDTNTITAIEGNTGSVDTDIETAHAWQLTVCEICEGDHMITKEEICSTCNGTGKVNSSVYYCNTSGCRGNGLSSLKPKECSYCGQLMIRKIVKKTCGTCNGKKKTESKVCNNCYGASDKLGKVSRCTNEGCKYSAWGSWTEYPDGVCYTTSIEYHEGSRVKQKTYPLTYARISGYGLPQYALYLNLENED